MLRWTASVASAAAQPEAGPLVSPVGDLNNSEALSGTDKVYLPNVYRSVIYVCGNISVDTVWSAEEGSYRVSCDVTVTAGVTLTIEAGTLVEFTQAGVDLVINGTLHAVGTEQDPIFFQPVSGTTPGSWGQIAFLRAGSGVLDHAILSSGGSGGEYTFTYGMLYIAGDDVLVQNSVIQGSAQSGIEISQASPTIRTSKILSNTDPFGGGMDIFNGSPVIENNLIAGNSASYGGGLRILSSDPYILNNIFLNNRASKSGSGIYLQESTRCNPTIRNNLLVSNTNPDGVIYNVDCAPVSDYNNFWENSCPNYYQVIPGGHDFSTDPLWVDPSVGDYHLAPDSPCIDAGDPDTFPATDLDGDLRPMGLSPDAGPDEFRTFTVVVDSPDSQAVPGSLVTFTLEVINRMPVSLTSVLLTDTLPVEAALEGYQAESFTCIHDGAAWGGQLSCALDSLAFLPGESQVLTITVRLNEILTLDQYVTNPVAASASAGSEMVYARDQARIHIFWCAVQFNHLRLEDDLQAAIDASTLVTDVIKVSGYCRVHDLILDKTLTLQGGWRSDFGRRDAEVYTTTLDADRLGRVILVDGEVAPLVEGFVIRDGYV